MITFSAPADDALEEAVLGVFQLAFDAQRYDVAEHLFCALEALERGSEEGSAVDRAYLMMKPNPPNGCLDS